MQADFLEKDPIVTLHRTVTISVNVHIPYPTYNTHICYTYTKGALLHAKCYARMYSISHNETKRWFCSYFLDKEAVAKRQTS